MQIPISIMAAASISSLGDSSNYGWESYAAPAHALSRRIFGTHDQWVAALPKAQSDHLDRIREADPNYKNLDASVLYAMATARAATKKAGWTPQDGFGVNIGSSRGATGLFEKHHKDYLEQGRANTLSSPTTTLGNLSSWVAHDLGTKGPEISHSITCSTALHAVLNGVAWLRSGMVERFLVGGSEAPLTPFTIAQIQALKIYATNAQGQNEAYPCRAIDPNKAKNSMVLGEGAAALCMEMGRKRGAVAEIAGLGYATEILTHNVSLSADAACFQRSMAMALGKTPREEVDVVVMHAPGTIKGDRAEHRAIDAVFKNHSPFRTGNKWKIGHTFGASGLLSLEMGIVMLESQKAFEVPYLQQTEAPAQIRKILVNAVGFGGNAVSILLSSPNS